MSTAKIGNASPDELCIILRQRGASEDSVAVIQESQLNGQIILSFEREDIQDLMPGPSMFLKRRKLWQIITDLKAESVCESDAAESAPKQDPPLPATPAVIMSPVRSTAPLCSPAASPLTSELSAVAGMPTIPIPRRIKEVTRSKPSPRTCGSPVVQISTMLNFQLYSDPTIVPALIGPNISMDVRNSLVRNQVAMMRAETALLDPPREPSSQELLQIAKALVVKYPMLKDDAELNNEEWGVVFRQMKRRLSNKKTTVKIQGKMPKRSKAHRILLSIGMTSINTVAGSSTSENLCSELACPGGAVAGSFDVVQTDDAVTASSTRDSSPCDSIHENLGAIGSDDDDGMAVETVGEPNEAQLARHHARLLEQFARQQPNHAVVQQLLKLEQPRRRTFVEGLKGDVAAKVSAFIGAYPCFKSVDECTREIQRLVAPDDADYVTRITSNMEKMWEMLLYFGLHQKVLKPPTTFDFGAKSAIVLKGLLEMFSTKGKTKKCSPLFRQLETDEDIDMVVRAVKDPQIIMAGDSLVIAVGGYMLQPLHRGEWSRAVIGLMATYYTFNLNYPTGKETCLLFLQTHMLEDAIHNRDKTSSYKQAVSAFDTFLGR